MQRLFEAIDSGAYDVPIFISVLVLFFLSLMWRDQRAAMRRQEKLLEGLWTRERFLDLRQGAQRLFETLGPTHEETQAATINALIAWTNWQNRPLPSPKKLDATADEEDAMQLLRVLEQTDSNPRYAM